MGFRDIAKRVVDDWRHRRWLQNASPIQLHPLDVTKLEEMVAEALESIAEERQDTR